MQTRCGVKNQIEGKFYLTYNTNKTGETNNTHHFCSYAEDKF